MRVALIIFLTCFLVAGFAQDPPSTYKEFEKQYKKNIRKTRINGVYIPKSLEESFSQLSKLSTEESLAKFKSAPEDIVAQKLHFGLGRWILINWNFEEGSRISHKLLEMGLRNNDDKIDFIIVSFHRYLNGLDLDVENRLAAIIEKRKKETESKQSRQLLEVKPIPKEKN